MRTNTCLKVLSVYFTSSSQSSRTRFPFRRRFNNILLMERVKWFADLVFCPWEARWCHRCLAWHSWIFLSPQSLSAVKGKKKHYDSRRQSSTSALLLSRFHIRTSHVLLLAFSMQMTSFNWLKITQIIILCPGVQPLRHLNTLFFVLFLLTSSFFKHTSLKSGKNHYFSLTMHTGPALR